MSRPLYLGFDVGTQSTKLLVVDADSHAVLARGAVAYDLMEGLPPGHAEQQPQTWVDAVVGALDAVRSQGVDLSGVRAVGVSGQQHGLVVLDDDDQVVRPAKLWCDTSTAAQAAALSEALGREVPAGFTAPKVRWLAENEPDNWARTRHVLLPHDYINFVLTGERSMEPGDASGTGWCDVGLRAFDGRALEIVHPELKDKLPGMIESGYWAGRVSAAGANLTGIPEGTPVSSGGGDNMMSAVGSGATAPGVAVVSLGTSGTVFAWSPTPIIDPEGAIAPFCASTGGYLPLLCVMNLTGVSEGVVDLTGLDHATLTEKAAEVPPGCDGLLWLPYLQGERVPNLPNATGSILGMRPSHLRPEVLYRAALEGTSLNLAWGVERLRQLGVDATEFRLVGGAAQNPLWRQILADCLGAPVVPLVESESAALGAALQALWTERVQSGENVGADEVAAPFVAVAGEVAEPGPGAEPLREALTRFRDAVGRHYR